MTTNTIQVMYVNSTAWMLFETNRQTMVEFYDFAREASPNDEDHNDKALAITRRIMDEGRLLKGDALPADAFIHFLRGIRNAPSSFPMIREAINVCFAIQYILNIQDQSFGFSGWINTPEEHAEFAEIVSLQESMNRTMGNA